MYVTVKNNEEQTSLAITGCHSPHGQIKDIKVSRNTVKAALTEVGQGYLSFQEKMANVDKEGSDDAITVWKASKRPVNFDSEPPKKHKHQKR